MATYSQKSVLGGTSYKRYPDPTVSGSGNEYGLYPWSTFRARLGSYASGLFTADEFDYTAASRLNFLLFTSDSLALGDLTIVLNANPEGNINPAFQVGVAGTPAFFKATPAGADVVVPAGKVGTGYVYNAAATADEDKNIFASGFPAYAGLIFVVAGKLDAVVFTNSPNISSPIGYQVWADVISPAAAAVNGALPIILLYSDYTKAMRDAGNLIVATGAAQLGQRYQIVGLYSLGVATPTPPIEVGVG